MPFELFPHLDKGNSQRGLRKKRPNQLLVLEKVTHMAMQR